mmetsp:Transcript_27726/g.70654  ORF Transcript_27726/g.70654 Transcript_27726/m.70654 type:complete len:214 (-) Transcript_27726:1048-1689(-)
MPANVHAPQGCGPNLTEPSQDRARVYVIGVAEAGGAEPRVLQGILPEAEAEGADCHVQLPGGPADADDAQAARQLDAGHAPDAAPHGWWPEQLWHDAVRHDAASRQLRITAHSGHLPAAQPAGPCSTHRLHHHRRGPRQRVRRLRQQGLGCGCGAEQRRSVRCQWRSWPGAAHTARCQARERWCRWQQGQGGGSAWRRAGARLPGSAGPAGRG